MSVHTCYNQRKASLSLGIKKANCLWYSCPPVLLQLIAFGQLQLSPSVPVEPAAHLPGDAGLDAPGEAVEGVRVARLGGKVKVIVAH